MNDQLIFEPFNLNGLPLRNRVVMAPMTRNRSGNHITENKNQTKK